MNQRKLGKTGRSVSEIGLGTWQLGTRWGDPFNHPEALKILETADKNGITFIDTADVYNGGKVRRPSGNILLPIRTGFTLPPNAAGSCVRIRRKCIRPGP